MADFLFHNGNITRELSFDEVVKATSPEYMAAYIASRK
jgi:hypothetical protein